MHLNELFDLTGKVALVTGGGRGIGKAIAEIYAEAGAKVAFTGRRAQWLDPTRAEFKERGFDTFSIVSDVTKPEDVDTTVAATLEKYGKIDILVNNAGITWGTPTEEMSYEKWSEIITTNVNGIFLMSQAVGRHMLKQGSGRIINIASVAAIRAEYHEGSGVLAYQASKGAVKTLTLSLAMEWGRRGILVNAIAPGYFPTRMAKGLIDKNFDNIVGRTALGRVGDLEELKGIALYLAAPASAYTTGQMMVVDGGISL